MFTLPRPLDVAFTDTSAEALRFSLAHDRIAPLATRIIDVPTRTEAPEPLALELTIIGSSHQAIVTAAGSDAFIETFACLGEDARDASPARPDWGRESVRHGRWAGFTQHRFTATRTQVPGDFPGAAAEVLATCADRAVTADGHLSVAFPGQPGALTALALTNSEPGRIGWQSWHCYPQHEEIVHSSSELRWSA
ncbi:DUF2617 family protein [Brevibacterium spongiae]|uniref:DUF2617 family protein n=1 Tax=Brevibacterium spongiae TaxID=2909672 RepID=A0ABY5SRQ4_9MICO|nr:DUF2617 family protein [Brevibacterium spongiae]UVI37000.1 DUF2617 family protein [Brevibacterium spongiae]